MTWKRDLPGTMTPDAGTGTGAIRQALEREVLRWPGVHTRKMFSLPAYLVEGKIFAPLVPEGIVLTRLKEGEREEISSRFPLALPSTGHGRPISSWVEAPMVRPDDLPPLVPYLRKWYEHAQG